MNSGTMKMHRMEIRVVTEAEVPLVAAILEDAAEWTSATHRLAWDVGAFANPRGQGWTAIDRDVINGTGYLIWVDGVAAGTFALRPRDLVYWPEAGDDALYLHRFAVRRANAGVGRRALPWMIAETRRQCRLYLRLDCWATNPSIRSYYESAGFTLHSERLVDGLRFSLYEMRVDLVT